MLQCAPSGCVLKYIVNGIQSGRTRIEGNSENSEIRFDFGAGVIRNGGNEIKLTIAEGSWMIFDDLKLISDRKAALQLTGDIFVKEVKAADYEITDGESSVQPLLVDVETLQAGTLIEVKLDGKSIFSKTTEDCRRHIFEAPMPAVKSEKKGKCTILADGRTIYKGLINRKPCPEVTPADYVDTKIGTTHSRWMIAPGPALTYGPMTAIRILHSIS